MGVLIAALVAYVGVYAGVLLGSISAEELPVGRYRIRMFQLVMLALFAMICLYDGLVQGQWIMLILGGALVAIEIMSVMQHRNKGVSLLPKEKVLLTYGVLGALGVLSSPVLSLTILILVFIYGLLMGSLIAEPFVDDRSLVPAGRPYQVALAWTWSYLPVLFVAVVAV